MTTWLWISVKYVLESAWCRVGIHTFGDPRPHPLIEAGKYGAVRLLLGRLVMLLVSQSHPDVSEPVLYVLLVLIRWLLWYVTGALIAGGRISAVRRMTDDRRPILWRLGGVAVSCLADVPALLLGFWTGRLWA